MSQRTVNLLKIILFFLGVVFIACDGDSDDGNDVWQEPDEWPVVPDTGTQGDPNLTWVRVTAGSFEMGSTYNPDAVESGNRDPYPSFVVDELPIHIVTMEYDFDMLKTEVTVAQYRDCTQGNTNPEMDPCVNLHQCGESVPTGSTDFQRSFYNWGRETDDRGNMPVNCIAWQEAEYFCRAAGGRLPTEAEWEYVASSGTDADTNRYPWGMFFVENDMCGDFDADAGVSDGYVVFNAPNSGMGCGLYSTNDVCSRPNGNTTAWAEGICDMSGNVREWVEDDYHPDYEGAPTDGSAWLDPLPDGGVPDPPEYSYPIDETMENWCPWCKGRRGSSFISRKTGNVEDLRVQNRSALQLGYFTSDTGFRCVRDLP